VPPTILSRVQRFDFRPIAPEQLAATLERILTEEGIAFEAAALPAIVRAADGSLRDALSLLDTAIAYGDGRLEAATTASLLGTTAPAEIRAFVEALLAREAAPALEAIDRAAREGEDLPAFLRDAIEVLRRGLVLKAAPTVRLADVTPTEAGALRGLGEGASLDELLYALRALLDADEAMRESPQPRVELEIAAVRATRRPQPQALEEILKRVEEAERLLRQQAFATPPGPRAQESLLGEGTTGPDARRPGNAVAPARPAPAPSPGTRATPVAAVPVEPPASRDEAAPAPRDAETVAPAADVATGWQRVVEDVMRRKPVVGAVLAQARPVSVRGGELQVVLSGNQFHLDQLTAPTNRDLIVQAVRRHVPGAARFEVVSEAASGGGGSVTDHPAVQAAIAELQGEVVAVRPRLPEGEGQ
jgi:DNA polymerase-3 subunit gamma/tau